MFQPDLAMPGNGWRTSSHSGQSGDCIEVAGSQGGIILVRDSRDREGLVLEVSPAAWRAFTGSLRA